MMLKAEDTGGVKRELRQLGRHMGGVKNDQDHHHHAKANGGTTALDNPVMGYFAADPLQPKLPNHHRRDTISESEKISFHATGTDGVGSTA